MSYYFLVDNGLSKLKIRESVPLAPLTTLKIGGPARYFLRAETEDDVIGGFEFADERDLPVFVLGGGSNILVSDKGFDGLVIQIGLKGTANFGPSNAPDADAEGRWLIVAAGEDWDEFVAFCVSRDLAGIECLSGIPGLVGGTPVQNVGAYGQEVSETIISVRCFDHESGNIVDLSNEQCGFAYRTSIFNTTMRERYVVLAVGFRLTPNGKPKIHYKDLREFFAGREPTLSEVREAVLRIRRAKSMVIDPSDPNSVSAGSFFKNPIVSIAKYDDIAGRFNGPVPKFEIDAESVKIPAAWLIENSGFSRGYALGNAGLSEKHTLAIINRGGASAADVLALKNAIQAGIEDKFGISLQPEPVFVGF